MFVCVFFVCSWSLRLCCGYGEFSVVIGVWCFGDWFFVVVGVGGLWSCEDYGYEYFSLGGVSVV